MNVVFPIYMHWNNWFFENNVLHQNSCPGLKKYLRFRKTFEFKSKLPKNLQKGDKVYIYEPKKHHGCGMIVGEFTVGEIIQCDNAYGAVSFISDFCSNVLNSDEWADKFSNALKTELPNYKEGYVIKFALDDLSMQHIKQHHDIPSTADYILNKERYANIELAQSIWKLCDEWLRKIGFYNEYGESNYKYAITVENPVRYDVPKALTSYTKLDGNVLDKAPQSYVYVQ